MEFKIYNNDCLEQLKMMEDKSVDLVLIDPPYNVNKDKRWDKWKTIDKYVAFMGEVFKESQRVLKPHGSLYFFHNDFRQLARLQNYIEENTGFVFRSFIVWDKGNFRANLWKYATPGLTLRSWFNTIEYIMYYTFEDYNPIEEITKDFNNTFQELREYSSNIHKYIGLNVAQISKRLGHRKAEHFFRYDSTQWSLPTPTTYQEMIEEFKIDQMEGFTTHEKLKERYYQYIEEYKPWIDKLQSGRYIHNLDDNHNNIVRTKEVNTGKYHPTQKPIDILERLIKTSTNEGGIVLDFFMGSGSTGVACMRTNRNFIGVERDPKYFNISKERIENEYNKHRDK